MEVSDFSPKYDVTNTNPLMNVWCFGSIEIKLQLFLDHLPENDSKIFISLEMANIWKWYPYFGTPYIYFKYVCECQSRIYISDLGATNHPNKDTRSENWIPWVLNRSLRIFQPWYTASMFNVNSYRGSSHERTTRSMLTTVTNVYTLIVLSKTRSDSITIKI